MEASIDQVLRLLGEMITVRTILRTLRAVPVTISTAASRDHFSARLCKAETVAQACIKVTAACTCPIADRECVTRGVVSSQRTVGIVARLGIGHYDVREERNEKIDDKHVECGSHLGA